MDEIDVRAACLTAMDSAFVAATIAIIEKKPQLYIMDSNELCAYSIFASYYSSPSFHKYSKIYNNTTYEKSLVILNSTDPKEKENDGNDQRKSTTVCQICNVRRINK